MRITTLWYEEADAFWSSHSEHNSQREIDPDEWESKGLALLAKAGTEAGRDSDGRFVGHMLKKGTMADQMAAMSVLAQDQPILHRDQIAKMIAIGRKRARRIAMQAVSALSQILMSNLLPGSRRLLRLRHPLTLAKLSKLSEADFERGLLWASFEDWLKCRTAELLSELRELMADPIEHIRVQAVKTGAEMLSSRPEGETVLLQLLVNKLGDPVGRVSNAASKALHDFLYVNPRMPGQVLAEVQQMVFKNQHNARCTYNAISFLTQMRLSSASQSVAESMVKLYLAVFQRQHDTAAHQNIDVPAKLLSMILTGINRALPYCGDGIELSAYVNSVFKIVHGSNWSASVQALGLLLQIVVLRNNPEGDYIDRYYRALYGMLVDPNVIARACDSGNTKLPLFLNIVFRSLKNRIAGVERLAAFFKRLLELCLLQKTPFVCGVLYLLSKLRCECPELTSLTDQPNELLDEGYDRLKRDPQHANGLAACVWELYVFRNHYHPSVSKFAEQILAGEPIKYSGDPLMDFTTAKFLDGFVFKNPKNLASNDSNKTRSRMFAYKSSALTEGLQSSESNPNEVFFHKYFLLQQKKAKKQTSTSPVVSPESEDEAEDDFVNELLEKSLRDGSGDPESGEDNGEYSELDDSEDGDDAVEGTGEANSSKTIFADADELSRILEEGDENGLDQWLGKRERKQWLRRSGNGKQRKLD